MRSLVVITALALTLTAAAGGDAPVEQPAKVAAKVEPLHTEVDATKWCFTALLSYPSATYIRTAYIRAYMPPTTIGLLDFAVNSAASQTPVLVRGDRHAGGWLIAYDLQKLCPDPVQLARLVSVWDSLAVRDSVFHVPDVTTGGGAAFLAPHLAAALAEHATDPAKSERVDVLLAQMTGGAAAILPADFLIEQLLSSTRGKYPEFRQMDFAQPKQGTPFSERLRIGGFFQRESRERLGEKGALLIHSAVTGKSRVVLTAYGVASRLPVAVTSDFKDGRTRPDEQFIRNLIEFEGAVDASEALIPMSNGLYEGVLADGKGNLQRTAPPDVVADHMKPDGYTHELEMGMSCFICHMPDDGYKTARNDMEFLLGADVDYFGDEIQYGGKILTKAEAVALVASRYAERIDEPDGVLGRARRDYIRAVATLTDYAIDPKLSSVQRLGTDLRECRDEYRYRLINADRAVLELGFRVPAGQGLAVLRQLVPPLPAGSQEDILIPLLRNGAEVKRDDFASIYPELARRAFANRNLIVGN